MAQAAPDSATIDRWRQAIRSTTLAHYQYQMGIALARTDEAEAATASYRRALHQQPDHSGARLRLINLLEDAPEGAAEAQRLRLEGQRLDPHFQQTGALRLLADDLNIDTAPGLADRIVDQAQVHGIPDAVRGPILYELGQLLVRARQPERAETALALAHQISPAEASILSLLATVRLQLGRLAALQVNLEHWLRLVPQNADALFCRARLYLLQADFTRADTDLKAAAEAGYPDRGLVLSFQIRCHLAVNDVAGALALYEAADRSDRQHWICQAYALLARLRLNPTDDLITSVDALLQQAGQHPLASVVKCLVLQAQGGDWQPVLSSLLRDVPSAFTFAAATVLERAAGGPESRNYWRKAQSYGDPFSNFYLMTMSAEASMIIEGDRQDS